MIREIKKREDVRIIIGVVLFIIMMTTVVYFYGERNEDQNHIHIPYVVKNNAASFQVDHLVEAVNGEYEYDEIHRALTMYIEDDRFFLVDGIPVLEKNGIYLPIEDLSFIVEGESIYLPATFISEGLGMLIHYEDSEIAFKWLGGPVQKVATSFERDVEEWSVEQMVNHLSFLHMPLKDAEVSTIPGHLPGSERSYRNGYHEGLDWYAYSSGAVIGLGTPVYGMGEGVIVRADHTYEEYPSLEIRNVDLQITEEVGETPLYIFDRLRGRQVWVQYGHGVMIRFAHLEDIPDSLQVGDKVDEHTVIGYIGNSGTSGAVNQDLTEIHLHQDMLIYGELFWKSLTQEEVKEVLLSIFSQ